MPRHEHTIETLFGGKWGKTISGSRLFCEGYLWAKQSLFPRPPFRLKNERGIIIREMEEQPDVHVGMHAGSPTADQYEYAAKRALACAARIRSRAAPRAGDSTKLRIEVCSFIPLSCLLYQEIMDWLLGEISERVSFSWGSANRTLVPASRFYCDLSGIIEDLDYSLVSAEQRTMAFWFLEKLAELGDEYIDMEN